jgi:hypothetical protein
MAREKTRAHELFPAHRNHLHVALQGGRSARSFLIHIGTSCGAVELCGRPMNAARSEDEIRHERGH